MKKRSRLEIYIDVLRAIKKSYTKPTRIMYKANLSWRPLREILSFLKMNKAVIERSTGGNRREYFLTEKGNEILRMFEQLESKLLLTERTEYLHE